ncbi:unnamed protein product, partial [Amoebophrya sp. A25]
SNLKNGTSKNAKSASSLHLQRLEPDAIQITLLDVSSFFAEKILTWNELADRRAFVEILLSGREGDFSAVDGADPAVRKQIVRDRPSEFRLQLPSSGLSASARLTF